jgi:hypothetical protein
MDASFICSIFVALPREIPVVVDQQAGVGLDGGGL